MSRRFLMMFSPATPNLEAPSPGLFVSTASTCSPTIRRSAASSSRLAVRRVPTTPSITCGRSYPYRSLLRAGVPLSLGSDIPGEIEYDPFEIIYRAVSRHGIAPGRARYDAAEAL